MKSRPTLLVCPLCGREYGTKSLPIHYPQCSKKWLDQEALKPANERRPLPTTSSILADALAGGTLPSNTKSIQEFNLKMNSKFTTESLEHCTICGRSFNYKAFQKHQNLCTPFNPFKPAGTSLGSQSLSTKLVPGKISGTAHKQAVLSPKLTSEEMIGAPRKVAGYEKLAKSAPTPRAISAAASSKSVSAEKSHISQVPVQASVAVDSEKQIELKLAQPLPAEVIALAEEVCSGAAGAEATAALTSYLHKQRVTSLQDLQFLQLDWLIEALQPAGVPPLLLNKFLTLAKQRASP